MKVHKLYILRRIADEYCLVPTGESVWSNNNIITISEAAAFLYDNIEEVRTEKELSELLVNEYGIDKATADNDTREFLDYLENQGIIRFS